jgi:hypothetical protein
VQIQVAARQPYSVAYLARHTRHVPSGTDIAVTPHVLRTTAVQYVTASCQLCTYSVYLCNPALGKDCRHVEHIINKPRARLLRHCEDGKLQRSCTPALQVPSTVRACLSLSCFQRSMCLYHSPMSS